ncbi:signal transduction histidine kinase [Sinomonas atrocyanea]|uniref:sensor histidine kinase n=1 Tax=Sinomonas atrocyanea TaxID=37927 RepID=UPI00278615D1|nr:PAS domain-containing sensor histidine kinase [Sinomonas atrocyanea]MDQ0258746.1 signal transduction histidine kinase [Sinomonas atrocyanea]
MSVKELATASKVLRYVDRIGARTRVLLCQLPLTVAVAVIALAAPSAWADAAAAPLFAAGILAQMVAAVLCLVLPWEQLGAGAALWIPALDLVSVWLLRNGGPHGALTGTGALAVFPVIWIAGSALSARIALSTALLGPLLITLPTLLAPGAAGHAAFTDALLLPLLMLTVAVAIRAAGAGLRLQERQLRAHQAKLKQLLEDAMEKEALLGTILDAASVGIVAVDAGGRPVRWNEAFRSLLEGVGWESPADFDIADRAFPVFTKDRRARVDPDRRVLHRAARGEAIDGEMVWLGWGPRARALQVVARPVDGDRGGAVVSYTDVTQLAQTAEDKAELVRTVAHEFRTPLTSVLGNLDLALEAELPAAARGRLEIAQGNAERLIELARDLMASSEVTLPIRPTRIDLSAVLAARAEAVQTAADDARVRLVVDLPPNLWVQADPLRIGQAADNLLSNAVKYSPDGGVVTLRAAAACGWATVEVADTGIGISADDRPHIFDRFFRTDAARDLDIPGVGLGLSFTRMVAERHGGRLEVQSEPGSGSVFSLVLPMAGPS